MLPTTELDAVNRMLQVIGQAPVNSLQDANLGDAALAHSVLQEVNIATQGEGWYWNTDHGVVFRPDAAGEIRFSPNTLKAFLVGHSSILLAKRGTRLYNRNDHSYLFPAEFRAVLDTVTFLPWEDLPESAKAYIAARAARTFAARAIGSDGLGLVTQVDELMARAELEREDNQQDPATMLDSPLSMSLINRRVTRVPL